MSLLRSCGCPLCGVERRLLQNLDALKKALPAELRVKGFDSPLNLIELLRSSPSDAQSDGLFQALLNSRDDNLEFVDSFLILAFLPMLHQIMRRIALYQPALSGEDITQQILASFLQVLRSNELRQRKSHHAFALSRGVKRRIFEWGRREGGTSKRLMNGDETTTSLAAPAHFERHAELRHFLNRCLEHGDLNSGEIDFLFRFKLEGTYSKNLLGLNGDSSNAVRQRMKRLISKLRRLAMKRDQGNAIPPFSSSLVQ